MPTPGSAGLIDEAMFQARVDDYLAVATQSLRPADSANVLAHLVRSQRDPSFVWDPSLVGPAMVSADPFRDTTDFELMNLQWVIRLGRDVLPAATITAFEEVIVNYRYRYDDPLPTGLVDNKWFWSENHRIIFAVIEYLGGLELPDRVFRFTGLTGQQHAERSRQRLIDLMRERAKFGYSEWHSNTYMKFSYAPLITLLEFADDPELVSMAAASFDVCMFDLATHTLGGVYGVTHGRAFKAAKTSGFAESTWGTAKLLFDTTPFGYQSANDIGPTFLAASTRYRLPEAIRQAARSPEAATIRERHGVHLDPHEPFTLSPRAPYGYDYDDVENLPFWWSHGALTAWQMIPQTLKAANRWRLFETPLFQRFSVAQQFAGVDPTIAQIGVREGAAFLAAGVLGEAHTYTWRSPDAMLSSVVDHRVGDAMEQAHAWQATLGPEAVVFTTHPSDDVRRSLDWSSDGGYWTGTASMPRSAQHERAAIHIYRPAYAAPTDPILGPTFGYQPYTHAYFPQERFDEVVETAGWVIGRKGDGYVALYSERPTQWRVHDPVSIANNGLTRPWDLVAPGSANNVWIVEVGRAADHGSFANFVAAISSATVEIVRVGGQVTARFVSPTAGDLVLPSTGSFTLDGVDTALRDHPRHSSPWAEQCALGEGFDIRAGGARLELDVATASRRVSGPDA